MQKHNDMIEYIKGEIIELTPTETVVECYGIGYNILISVQTYSALEGKKNATIFIHHYIREDEELYYGFATKEERHMFRLLIGVSGVGAATARMMLSSLTVEEIQTAILSEYRTALAFKLFCVVVGFFVILPHRQTPRCHPVLLHSYKYAPHIPPQADQSQRS